MGLRSRLMVLGLLGTSLAILFLRPGSEDKSPSQIRTRTSTARIHLQRKESARSRESRRHDEQESLAIIRAELDLVLSDHPEQASLDKVLAACAALQSTSSIIDLLFHPELGWKPMAAGSLCFDSSDRSIFGMKMHEALFARWGELDFEGAFKQLRAMGPFGYPTGGPGDYDEHWSSTAFLFKGAARVDGQRAFDVLDKMSHHSTFQEIAIGPLMEEWARSDPDAAWETLVNHTSEQNFTLTIEGFFKGLAPDTAWPEMCDKVEALAGAPQGPADESFEAQSRWMKEYRRKEEYRQYLAKAWISVDPAAALGWYAPLALNGISLDIHALQPDPKAEIIAQWMKADLDTATKWLSAWQPKSVNKVQVFARLKVRSDSETRGYNSPEIQEAVGRLIRDPD